jgi:hypothetical protein
VPDCSHIRCRKDLIEIHHKHITDEDLEDLVTEENSKDDDIPKNCTRNLKALAQIMKLLIEKVMACGDEELDEH